MFHMERRRVTPYDHKPTEEETIENVCHEIPGCGKRSKDSIDRMVSHVCLYLFQRIPAFILSMLMPLMEEVRDGEQTVTPLSESTSTGICTLLTSVMVSVLLNGQISCLGVTD